MYEIKKRFSGEIIFSFGNNIKECIKEAKKQRINLSGAILSEADLSRLGLGIN